MAGLPGVFSDLFGYEQLIEVVSGRSMTLTQRTLFRRLILESEDIDIRQPHCLSGVLMLSDDDLGKEHGTLLCPSPERPQK